MRDTNMSQDNGWWANATVVTPCGGMDLLTDGAAWAIVWDPSPSVRAILEGDDPEGQVLLGSGSFLRVDFNRELPDYAPEPVDVCEATWAWALQYTQDLGRQAAL